MMRYWTRPIHLKYEVKRRIEKMVMWLVWRLPRQIVYWSAIRVGAHATTGQFGNQIVPDLLFVDALKRWDEPRTASGVKS